MGDVDREPHWKEIPASSNSRPNSVRHLSKSLFFNAEQLKKDKKKHLKLDSFFTSHSKNILTFDE